jgi:RHS repeat-associated protein
MYTQHTIGGGSDSLAYLHSDHLGSLSASTDTNGTTLFTQEYTPWGDARRTVGVNAHTTINYTGQRRDGTGLVYYHARSYDPALGRFLSADSIVPGAADGSMDGVAVKPLTVDFHEPGFVASVNAENRQAFWFQHTEQAAPWGPANPQALNRYSYVLNNPLKYTDPTGHARRFIISTDKYQRFMLALDYQEDMMRNFAMGGVAAAGVVAGVACGPAGVVCGAVVGVGVNYVLNQAIAEGYYTVDMALENAYSLAIRYGGSIQIEIGSNDSITITALDKNGKAIKNGVFRPNPWNRGSIAMGLLESAKDVQIPIKKVNRNSNKK